MAFDADGAATLLGEAGVVEDQDAIALGGQAEHVLERCRLRSSSSQSMAVKRALEALLGGPRYDLGDGGAVLVGALGKQPGEVAFQCLGSLAPVEWTRKGTRKGARNSANSGSGVPGACGIRVVFMPLLRISRTKVQLTK